MVFCFGIVLTAWLDSGFEILDTALSVWQQTGRGDNVVATFALSRFLFLLLLLSFFFGCLFSGARQWVVVLFRKEWNRLTADLYYPALAAFLCIWLASLTWHVLLQDSVGNSPMSLCIWGLLSVG